MFLFHVKLGCYYIINEYTNIFFDNLMIIENKKYFYKGKMEEIIFFTFLTFSILYFFSTYSAIFCLNYQYIIILLF